METRHAAAFGGFPGAEPMQAPEAVAAMLRLTTLGWGTKRIAQELGCSRGTVKRYLQQGAWEPYRSRPRTGALMGLESWLRAVNYDFDAPGPASRLVAVTIANRVYTDSGYETLLASRNAAAAAIAGPLQQKSATELVASGPGCQIRLLPNAAMSIIYEVYQLPNGWLRIAKSRAWANHSRS